MKVITAKNPRRNIDGSIELLVLFDELQHLGELPFTASASDTEQHGRDLHQRAEAGEFGVIQ
jgi:hypothetical protein